MNAGVTLEAPRDGGRPARLRVALLDAESGAVRFSSEFKTTLSEPVDEQQWQTLGEGAAYRILGPLARLQTGRNVAQQKLSALWGDTVLKLALDTRDPLVVPPLSAPEGFADAGSLALRVSRYLAWPAVEQVSRIETSEAHRAQ